MPSADQWNERFRQGEHSSPEPDSFVVESADYWNLLPPNSRTAADIACGAGRHAVFLAKNRFQTLALDFAEQGLLTTRLRAEEHAVRVETRQLDLEADGIDLGHDRFHLIVVVHFLHRPLFGALKRALNSGGLIVYKTYTAAQLDLPTGPNDPRHVLESNELLERFADYRVLRYQERIQGEGTAAIVAQKP